MDKLINKIKHGLKVESDDDEKSWWDKFEEVVTDANELELNRNVNSFLWPYFAIIANM